MQPGITLSSLDYERLHALLDSPAARGVAVADSLAQELDRADILEPAELPADVVSMNSTVRFVFDPEPEEFEYTLSWPREADQQDKPRISVFTPIGAALLGLRVGDAIDWTVPSGKSVRLRVTELLDQPESRGEYLGG
jgi:regulator of nucleoside diphosphate kinase